MLSENKRNKDIIKSVCSKAKLREYISECSFDNEHDAEILNLIYLKKQRFWLCCGCDGAFLRLDRCPPQLRRKAACEPDKHIIIT